MISLKLVLAEAVRRWRRPPKKVRALLFLASAPDAPIVSRDVIREAELGKGVGYITLGQLREERLVDYVVRPDDGIRGAPFHCYYITDAGRDWLRDNWKP
jgi:hypothetical protein